MDNTMSPREGSSAVVVPGKPKRVHRSTVEMVNLHNALPHLQYKVLHRAASSGEVLRFRGHTPGNAHSPGPLGRTTCPIDYQSRRVPVSPPAGY
jgi:hypothetical protein